MAPGWNALHLDKKLKLLKYILQGTRRKGNCLIYYGTKDKGYPTIKIQGKTYNVTRIIMHLIADFPLDSELYVLHDDINCSSKACIEFDHLRTGTQTDNIVGYLAVNRRTNRSKRNVRVYNVS